jgi:hypothetical protein
MSSYTSTYADIRPYPDASLRTQGGWISTQLDNLWPKTADTGQVDWATVTSQNANADDFRGYEIRKSNDGLKDIYVKIEYGSGYGWYSWALRFTVGSGSNGSGTITGATGQVRMRTALAYPGNVVYPGKIKVAGDAGRLSFAFVEDRPGGDGFFSYTEYWGGVAIIQRYTDSSGTDTSNGVMVITQAEDGGQYGARISSIDWYDGFELPAQAVTQGIHTAGSNMLSTFVKTVKGSASYIPVYPYGFQTSREIMLVRDMVFVPRAYQTFQTTGTFDHMGSSRTYIYGYGNVTSQAMVGYTAPQVMGVMVRYE